jgi:hypothetical protein
MWFKTYLNTTDALKHYNGSDQRNNAYTTTDESNYIERQRVRRRKWHRMDIHENRKYSQMRTLTSSVSRIAPFDATSFRGPDAKNKTTLKITKAIKKH